MATDEAIPANSVTFKKLCQLFENLYKRKCQKQEQDKILANFINDFRVNAAKIVGKKNTTFFPVLRLLLPDRERERAAYNLKETKLSILLVRVLSLNKQSKDAQKLLNFRSLWNTSTDCDFSSVAYFVLKNRMNSTSDTLTIGDVNSILDKIASAEVGNKSTVLDEAFSYFIQHSTPEQMKWFLRIILKDLKLGMGLNRILSAFHPDAPELYDNCNSLFKVCEELDDGNVRPLELGIEMFFAVSPMLSERLNVTKIAQLPSNKSYHIEIKFDGERFQMHMQNGQFEYFSRKGFTYSDNYGKTYEAGLLTPLLKNCFNASINSFILDGEMMGWHKQHQCFGSKGMAFDVKKITENSKFRPCFCAFDILFYNGKSLIGSLEKGGLPLSKRLEILDNLFKDIPGVIQHSKRQIVKESSDILDALNKAIQEQEEGIVVKALDAYYIPSQRNAGWYKIKPEYTDGTMTDLDLVIIGADEAESKRLGRAKSFYVACVDPAASGDAAHRWLLIGSVYTGLTNEERERICTKLEANWVRFKQTPPPPCLIFNKEKPDFWIMPEHSVVVQVRATELIRSKGFGSDYTLRFPRIEKIRDDKPVTDIMTLEELNGLVADKGAVVKLSTKQVNEDQIEGVDVKIRKKRLAVEPQVAEQFKMKSSGDVEVTSKALLGRKVCILSDDEDCHMEELIRILESHGGKHVQNQGPDTWCCVAGRITQRVHNVIASQDIDVATTSWLRSLPASETQCSLYPLDMLAIKTATKLKLCSDYDIYGDSFYDPLDENTLRKCFDKMDSMEPEIYLTPKEMLNMDQLLFGDTNPFSFLRSCFIHFIITDANILDIEAKMYGATLCDIDSYNLTHVVVDQLSEKSELEKRITNASIVSKAWLETCISERKLIPVTEFLL